MASFRHIKPTITTNPVDNDGAQTRQTPATPVAPPGPSESRTSIVPGKRTRGSHQVAQACPHCRQSKAKCDGVRPRCGNCVAKGKPCGYIGEAGQSRQAAMMTRLETLENIFKQLQSQPEDEASKIYSQIRAVDEGSNLSKIVADALTEAGSEPSQKSSISASASMPGSAQAASPRVESGPDVFSESASQSSRRPSKQQGDVDTTQSPAATNRQPPILAEISLPDRHTIVMVTDAFFHYSLQPFHVFSREEIAVFMGAVFPDSGQFYPAAGHVAIACLAAVAAVGARYLISTIEKHVAIAIYEVARFYFESVIEEAPLDAIKCCVLMAMCNFMAKSTVALAYVECGLGLSRRQGVYAPDPRDTTLTRPQWAECRRAWRTLMCLSSWIPFTAGHNEDHIDSVSPIYLFDVDIGPNMDDADALQIEMTKVSLLKADLLRVRLAPPVIDIQTLESANHDLQSWYADLPEEMLLGSLRKPDPRDGIQSCIYYTHLLHLDAIMLLSRRALSQFVRAHGYRRRKSLPWTPLDQALASQANQGVLAASHSSRILRLLQDAGQARELSWLIMNQTNTACAMLLLSALQKQLHQFQETEWAENFEQAGACLSILEACGVTDPLARKLHEQLSGMQKLIADGRHVRSTSVALDAGAGLQWNKDLYLLTPPQEAPSDRAELAVQLVNLLCRPFDEAFERQARTYNPLEPRVRVPSPKESRISMGTQTLQRWGSDGSRSSRGALSRAGLSQKLEEWSFESTVPFRVDARRTMRTEGSGAVPSLQTMADTALSGGGDSRPRSLSWIEGDDGPKRRKP